jgi:UDP-N-acetyl-D-mannosaminuronate dehydrogenase
VLGLDIDPGKIKEIEARRSYIRHIPAEDVAVRAKASRFYCYIDVTN